MITARDYQLESVAAVLECRKNAETCPKCGDKPGNRYEPGCRRIGCERTVCPLVVVDASLVQGFAEWNRRRKEENRLASRSNR
jgi:hypothetical protein